MKHPYYFTFYWEENYGYDTTSKDEVIFAESKAEAYDKAMAYAEEYDCTDYRMTKTPYMVGKTRHSHISYYS